MNKVFSYWDNVVVFCKLDIFFNLFGILVVIIDIMENL